MPFDRRKLGLKKGKGNGGWTPREALRLATGAQRAVHERGTGWLRAVLAPCLTIAGIDFVTLPAGIGPETQLPGPVWSCVVEWCTRRAVTGQTVRPMTPRRRFPRPGAYGELRRQSWRADETVTLGQWAAVVRRRRERVEAAGLQHVAGAPPVRRGKTRRA